MWKDGSQNNERSCSFSPKLVELWLKSLLSSRSTERGDSLLV